MKILNIFKRTTIEINRYYQILRNLRILDLHCQILRDSRNRTLLSKFLDPQLFLIPHHALTCVSPLKGGWGGGRGFEPAKNLLRVEKEHIVTI